MMDEEEEDDDEEDDDEDESSDDEGEEEEGSDDEDAIPLLGFDGDAPHGRMYRRNYPRGSGGGSHLLLPMLEDGPGRVGQLIDVTTTHGTVSQALGIRDLLPRRRGSGGTIGGPMGADRVNTNPNAIPPSAMLSTQVGSPHSQPHTIVVSMQSLLLPRPPRKVWSFTNQEGNPDKSVGRYSAVHPFFEGRQNNRMPPLVVRPHGDLGASNDPSSTNDGAEVDLITGVVEPPTSRSLTSMLCNRVQEAVAAGLKEVCISGGGLRGMVLCRNPRHPRQRHQSLLRLGRIVEGDGVEVRVVTRQSLRRRLVVCHDVVVDEGTHLLTLWGRKRRRARRLVMQRSHKRLRWVQEWKGEAPLLLLLLQLLRIPQLMQGLQQSLRVLPLLRQLPSTPVSIPRRVLMPLIG